MNSPWQPIHDLLDSTEPLTWVVTGDSITHGLVHTRAGRSYFEHLHEAVRGEIGRLRDVLINTACSGWRANQLLEDFDLRVARWRPDIVIIMIGTNDCSTDPSRVSMEPEEYAADVREFVNRCRDLGSAVILMTPPGGDLEHAPHIARVGAFAEAMRGVAAELDVPLVDQQKAWTDHAAEHGWSYAHGLMNDPVHANEAGHAFMALPLFEGLGLDKRAPRTTLMLQGVATRF